MKSVQETQIKVSADVKDIAKIAKSLKAVSQQITQVSRSLSGLSKGFSKAFGGDDSIRNQAKAAKDLNKELKETARAAQKVKMPALRTGTYKRGKHKGQQYFLMGGRKVTRDVYHTELARQISGAMEAYVTDIPGWQRAAAIRQQNESIRAPGEDFEFRQAPGWEPPKSARRRKAEKAAKAKADRDASRESAAASRKALAEQNKIDTQAAKDAKEAVRSQEKRDKEAKKASEKARRDAERKDKEDRQRRRQDTLDKQRAEKHDKAMQIQDLRILRMTAASQGNGGAISQIGGALAGRAINAYLGNLAAGGGKVGRLAGLLTGSGGGGGVGGVLAGAAARYAGPIGVGAMIYGFGARRKNAADAYDATGLREAASMSTLFSGGVGLGTYSQRTDKYFSGGFRIRGSTQVKNRSGLSKMAMRDLMYAGSRLGMSDADVFQAAFDAAEAGNTNPLAFARNAQSADALAAVRRGMTGANAGALLAGGGNFGLLNRRAEAAGLAGRQAINFMNYMGEQEALRLTTGRSTNVMGLLGASAQFQGMGANPLLAMTAATSLNKGMKDLAGRGASSSHDLIALMTLGGFKPGGSSNSYFRALEKVESGDYSEDGLLRMAAMYRRQMGGNTYLAGGAFQQAMRSYGVDLGLAESRKLVSGGANAAALSGEVMARIRNQRGQAPGEYAERTAESIDPGIRRRAEAQAAGIAANDAVYDANTNWERINAEVARQVTVFAGAITTFSEVMLSLEHAMAYLLSSIPMPGVKN